MVRRLINHARSNVIAYLALFIALGGSSYAAVALPRGSVGTLQLRNGAVTMKKLAKGSVSPAKFDAKRIGGSVRHWAKVAPDGKIKSSDEKAHDNGIARDGNYVISWGQRLPRRCAVIATTRGTGGVLSPSAGYANTNVASGRQTAVVVNTYNAVGQPSPDAFSLVVIC